VKRMTFTLLLVPVAFAFGSVVEAQAQPNMFPAMEACEAALDSGNFRFYEPRYFGLRMRGLPDGINRVVVPLETDLCLEMLVVGGRRFVVQREGTLFRALRRMDGSLALYARHDCGNPVYGVVFPPPVRRPSAIATYEEAQREVRQRQRVETREDNMERTPVQSIQPPPPKRHGKKYRWAIVAGTAVAGGVAWYYLRPCPPGTVRR
jgi:hypothetical protein